MPPRQFAFAPVALCVAAALLVSGCDRQKAATGQAQDGNSAANSAQPGATQGSFGSYSVDRSHRGDAMPTASFAAPGGKPITLTAFHGKPLILTLWATWCGPCIKEMPVLAKVAASANGQYALVAIAQFEAPGTAATWMKSQKIDGITPYEDPNAQLASAFAANLPLTVLYDAEGREVLRVAGALDWDSADGKALLKEAGINR